MTILNATLNLDAGWLAQDTAATGFDPAGHLSASSAATVQEIADIAQRSGLASEEAFRDPDIMNSKITAYPERRMVVGCGGMLLLSILWRWRIKSLPAGDIEVINQFARLELPRIHADLMNHSPAYAARARGEDQFIIQLGYSKALGHMAGFMYSAAQGFSPERLTPPDGQSRHVACPLVPLEADAEWRDIADRWEAAAYGDGTHEFHRRLAAYQHRTFQEGYYQDGLMAGAISREIDLVRVSSRGGVEFLECAGAV